MISFSRGAQTAKHRAVQGGSLAGGRGRRIRGEIRGPTRRREIVLGGLLPAFGRHSVAEEVLVYPEVEDKVSAQEAQHAREEHAEAEETLHRLEKLDADDPAFDDELATLMGEIRHHIQDEEGQMFMHMRQVLDADELRRLGSRVEAFKKSPRPARIPTCRTSGFPAWP